MKKTLCVLCAVICLLSLSLSSCSKEDYVDQIEVGMTWEEYTAIVPEDIRLDFLNFSCFTASDGKFVVVKFRNDSPNSVFSVDVVDSAVLTEDSFSRVEKGMTFLETVKLIGLPREQLQMGVIVVEYDSQDGKKYQVQFEQGSDDLFELYVIATTITE
ncbi:MAG: hypothetical protein IJB88_03785 [Clostridia bacterium]|nr:hypothetical protein [Clostridia bacterium]